MDKGISGSFPTLDEFLVEAKVPISDEMQREINGHLEHLQKSFLKYFQKFKQGRKWPYMDKNPFSDTAVRSSIVSIALQTDLLELNSDTSA